MSRRGDYWLTELERIEGMDPSTGEWWEALDAYVRDSRAFFAEVGGRVVAQVQRGGSGPPEGVEIENSVLPQLMDRV